MAARTFTTAGVNNLWSNVANWDGGAAVPQNNDSVTIPTGQTCEFDVDISGYADGIAGITVTGTLSLTRSAGTYYLKIKAASTIAGAGTFDCGTLASPIPFAAKHTITGGAGWYINGSGGLTMTVYAAEPSIKTILLSGDEAIGQTVLSVDTDVTGDIWADGDTITISDINQAKECEERVIAGAGIAAGAITVTVGLTAAKSTGAVVCLISRNVKFIGVGAGVSNIYSFPANKITIAGGMFYGVSTSYMINACLGATISGGVFTASLTPVNGTTGVVISGGVFSNNIVAVASCSGVRITGGVFVGNTQATQSCSGANISGGTFVGNTHCIQLGFGTISGGTFRNSTNGITTGNYTIKNATFSGNTRDINTSMFSAFNTTFGSTTEVYLYAILSRESYSESLDHDATAGAFRSWTTGGVTTKQSTTYPTGFTSAMQTILENASSEGFWQREVVVGAGASVNITSYLRKSASMSYLPRVIVFNKASTDPFAGGSGLHTFTMTNSVDTWESDLYTYANGTAEDVTLVIRTLGENATGNLFSWIDVEQINVDLTSVIASLAALKGLETAIVGSYDGIEVLRLLAAVLAGKASGGGTSSVIFRDLADTKNVVTATVDSSGNRTAVTLDVT